MAGLYLSRLTGCDVVMVDLPLPALRIARERAVADGLEARCKAILADAAALPFDNASFDALSHSDLLCCTPDKLGVLRACRRVARAGARMVFTIIGLAPSLADSTRRIAIEAAPRFVETDDDYAVLLDRSGWRLGSRIDLTTAHLRTMRAEVDGTRARSESLALVLGSGELSERLKRGQATDDALDAGFLRRELFVAQAGA